MKKQEKGCLSRSHERQVKIWLRLRPIHSGPIDESTFDHGRVNTTTTTQEHLQNNNSTINRGTIKNHRRISLGTTAVFRWSLLTALIFSVSEKTHTDLF